MALKTVLRHILQEARGEGEGNADAEARPTPAQVNARGNRSRLNRINEIGNTADGARARQLVDVDGERVVGRFQNGELDNSEAARERAALEEDERAEQALQEQRERAEEAERLEQEEARRLQAEGAPLDDSDGGAPNARGDGTTEPDAASEAGDERVVNGVKHYLTIVNGQERWLTLKELRDHASKSDQAEETLQRAEEALQRATQTALTPKAEPVELPDEKELANIILAANLGDEEAVRKLASVISSVKGAQNPDLSSQISRQVAQQTATQREVDRAEEAQADFLGSDILAPIFRARLTQFATAKPKTRIADAYKAVGDQMRKDFAAMLKPGQGAPLTKDQRKREIVNPPASAGRQQARQDEDREVPVSEQIDQIAKLRGQARAHRIRRS